MSNEELEDFPIDAEVRSDRIKTALITLFLGWFLSGALFPTHSFNHRTIIVLALWGAFYFFIMFASLSIKIQKERAQFKSWLRHLGLTPEKADEARAEMEHVFEILTRPYEPKK